MRAIFTLLALMIGTMSPGQSYLSERTGNMNDLDVDPEFGICLMGGAGEMDEAMVWFLEKANGGDVLVIRAGDIGGYNNYMYSELGVALNSVETIAFQSEEAATDPYVLQRLSEAEAIWMAGGNQANYYNYWKDTGVMDAINNLLNVEGGAVGGISAGMAILGEAYFPALIGTVDSEEVLADPLDNSVLLGYSDFIDAPFLENTITETHFNDPDRIRYGRIMGFMARLKFDEGIIPKAIASNEYCAVTIDDQGIARAWGEFPTYDDDYLYFLQENPANTTGPEVLEQNIPLTWVRDEEAVKVYKVPGLISGEYWFDLNNWEVGNGGSWQNWWVDNGELFMEDGAPLAIREIQPDQVRIFPNPASSIVKVEAGNHHFDRFRILDVHGREMYGEPFDGNEIHIDLISKGIYILELRGNSTYFRTTLLKISE